MDFYKKTTRRHPVNKVASNLSTPARNLPKNDLGGVIFGCKDHTIRECFSKMLFGLPAPYFAYVKKISPGLPLFLFNYSDWKLHGVIEAAGHGQLNSEERYFNADGETNGTRRKNYNTREGADNSTSDMVNKFRNLNITSHPNFPSTKQPNEEWNSCTSKECVDMHNIQPLLSTPRPSVGRDYSVDQHRYVLAENCDISSAIGKAS
nr:Kelch_1 domain-containing protein/Dev_Cell_Death domain-containing protein [Ipomoea trifida]